MKKSNRPTIFERLQDSWTEYLQVIAAMFAIAIPTINYYNGTSIAWEQRASLIALLAYYLVLLLFLFWFTHTYSRKARYAECLRLVHQSIHEIRDLANYLERCYRRKDKYLTEVVNNSLQGCLDSLARAYSLATGTNCRVCIKIVAGSDPKTAYVRTASRDRITQSGCIEKDKKEGADNQITLNSDYTYLIYGGHSHYLNNDIGNTNGYLNTSTQAYGGKLPYSAVLVLPIRTTHRISSKNSSIDPPTVLGFLCIDNDSRFTFTEKWDVQMGAIVADALCPIIDLWNRLASKNAKQTQGSK